MKLYCALCEKETKCTVKERFEGGGFYECGMCALMFAYPPQEGDSSYYEESYGALGGGYGEDKWEYGKFQKDARRLRLRGTLLEIGCGPGFFLSQAIECGFAVYGIDFNQLAVEEAKRRGFSNVEVADISKLNRIAGNKKFDIVALFNTLEHFAAPNAVLKAVHAILADDGFIVLSVPNTERLSLKINFRRRREAWDYPPHHLMRWPKQSLAHILRKNGFLPVSIEEESVNDTASAFRLCYDLLRFYTNTTFVVRLKEHMLSDADPSVRSFRQKIASDIGSIFSFLKNFLILLPALLFTPLVYLVSKRMALRGTNIYVLARKV